MKNMSPRFAFLPGVLSWLQVRDGRRLDATRRDDPVPSGLKAPRRWYDLRRDRARRDWRSVGLSRKSASNDGGIEYRLESRIFCLRVYSNLGQ